jgi:TPR repeat protein
MYQKGELVSQDYKEAMKWARRAVELGSDFAMRNIGAMYYNGNGVSQDYAEAMSWFQKAAERDDEYAMAYIGFLYRDGKGVPADKSEEVVSKSGEKWARKGARFHQKTGRKGRGGTDG